VATWDLWLLLSTLVGAFFGAWSVLMARGSEGQRRTRFGRSLFIVILIILGGLGLLAATLRAHSLPPLGLVAGLLVVAMVWESPEPQLEK
jgi:hypothetical protein